MSVPDINSLRDDLLVELAKRAANNGKPGDVVKICTQLRTDVDWIARENAELARNAGWLLVRNVPPLAKAVVNTAKPGALFLALTAAGKSRASELFIAKQPLTRWQKLKSVPRSDWIAFGSFLVSAGALVVAILALSKA